MKETNHTDLHRKSIGSTIFPKQACNDINFNPIIGYIFGALTLLTIVRSLIHIFAPDGGANSIATIMVFSGTPDPNAVIYHIFSLWGLSQLLMGVIYLVVLFKYRNLIPFMYVLMIIEYGMRIIIGKFLKPLDDVLLGTAPGGVGNYILVPLALMLLVWSFFPTKTDRKD